MKILVHTSFIGDTGYNNHARSFFTALNKFHTVKIRNYTVGKTWKGYNQYAHDEEPYMTEEMRNMLILQTLYNSDGTVTDFPLYGYNFDFKPDLHIILNDVNHRYFYDKYDGYVIGYNVWETTEYPYNFFNQIKTLDEFWVPSEWQKNNLIKQGYDKDKIFVVPEGVDVNIFKPEENIEQFEKFTFLLFGRWEYRKSTKEIIETFIETFKQNNNVQLLVSADNMFANDGFNSTEERLDHYGLINDKVKVLHFLKREDYITYLKKGHVFVSCARSEGWNLPLIEAMSCGTPSIYSNWGAQLQFANGKGIPVSVLDEVPATKQDPNFVGNYIEPDFQDLSYKMKLVYETHDLYKKRSIKESQEIHEEFNWGKIASQVSEHLLKINSDNNFVFVTTGNIGYMPVIEKLVKSINEFSNHKIIVYGVDCDVPFDYPCLIKKTINPPKYSEHDRWYWKQYACIESLKEDYENYVWIDGDVIVNYNIDNINKYMKEIDNYPISDIHVQKEFFGEYNDKKETQLFNEKLCELFQVKKSDPYAHVCMYIYNKKCEWWFNEIIEVYKQIPLIDYKKYLLWNDEGIDNFLRWKYGFKKYLPLSNFDTSSYDGDVGYTANNLKDFFTFWVKNGPYNFNKIYGYQFIPKDKSNIIYFHGNKNSEVSEKMINFIKLKRDKNFHSSEYFFTEENVCKNLGEIKGFEGSSLQVADQYGWDYCIYHEIFNLQDYYLHRTKRINDGDIVVDLGANIGIFNRWAYSQGASKVISFEPDKRYFKLLQLNSDDRSILFNAGVHSEVGRGYFYESDHLGGSNFLNKEFGQNFYKARTYTLDYLFESNLIDKIDFLKVDVEGSELDIFSGISDENLLKIKNISMEYHHAHFFYNENDRNNLINRLNSLGFRSFIMFLGTDNNLQMLYFWRE
jgi:FkbM family methyltransferase